MNMSEMWLWCVTLSLLLQFCAHLQVTDVFEDKRVVDVDGFADLVVHGVDVGLIDSHAFPGQRRSVVDGNVVELWVVLPVLVWTTGTNSFCVTIITGFRTRR